MDAHLGNPIVRGGLTIFPVFNGTAVTCAAYRLEAGSLVVAEREGSPVVSELVVTNEGDRPALVLEGELLEGGWQHRVATRSVLVGAGSSMVIDVRCVEQGRWNGAGRHQRGGRRAPVTIRAATDEQGAVWERVRRYGASSAGSLLETTRDVERAAFSLIVGLYPLPFQSGVLFGINGQPLMMEVFDCPETLALVWDQLLLAAAIDAVTAPAVETPGRRARRFARRVKATPTHAVDGGIGEGGQGRSPHVRLSTLSWDGRTLHTSAINPRHELVAA